MIGIIDYGMGNLGSVRNALRYLDLPAKIIQGADELLSCRSLILPGVGAFGDCLNSLKTKGLLGPICSWIEDDRPFLGICLGLQALFEASAESPGVAGLGVFGGTVEKFVAQPGLKVPQIGWNRLRFSRGDCPLWRGLEDGVYVYFVHSFYVVPTDLGLVAGVANYGGEYTAAVWRSKVLAVQFHPEKSHRVGLQMLRNFGELK